MRQKITETHIKAVKAYLRAKAFHDTLKEESDKVWVKVLEIVKPTIAKKNDPNRFGKPITDKRHLFLASESDCIDCDEEYNHFAPNHLKWDGEGRCPVLMADSVVTQAQRVLVGAFENFLPGICLTWDILMCNFDKFDKYIDLLCRLVGASSAARSGAPIPLTHNAAESGREALI